MRLYLIRHGQTQDNEQGTRHTAETELSEIGLQQAEAVAKRFKDLPFDLILSSHFKRAQQTAEFFANLTDKEIVFNELLRERKKYDIPEGTDSNDPEITQLKKLLKDNFENSDFHHDAEETFWEFKKREEDFLKSMEMLEDENVLIVTHSDVIRMLSTIVVFGQMLTPQIYAAIKDNLSHKNTGLTVLERKDDKWRLVTWNDHAHLSEI